MISFCFSSPPSHLLLARTGYNKKHSPGVSLITSFREKLAPTITLANAKKVVSTTKRACNSSNDRNEAIKELQTTEEIEMACKLRGLSPELIPKHVAMITDGSRRWAKEKNLSPEFGYLGSLKPFKDTLILCCELGIKVFSLFVISSASFRIRPKEEIALGFSLFESAFRSEMGFLKSWGIRVSFIGAMENLPKPILDYLTQVEEDTKDYTRLHLVLAIDYTGRYDIVEACKSLSEKVKIGQIQHEDINDVLFQEQLQTKCISEYPNPDLFIRTGGKIRLANYMLWQMAYTELVFVDKYIPDCTGDDFVEALKEFQKRSARFGGYKY